MCHASSKLPQVLYTPVILAKLVRVLVWVEHGRPRIVLESVVFQHAAVHPDVVTLDRERWLRHGGLDNKMVVAVWAVFIRLLEVLRILPKTLLALLACKGQFVFLP